MTIVSRIEKGPAWADSWYAGHKQPFAGYLPGDSIEMVSFGNDVRNLGSGDVGSPWLLESTKRTYGFGYLDVPGYRGPTLPSTQLPVRPTPIETRRHDSDYDSAGANAISRTEPTNPVFDCATFLGETASDCLPLLVGTETWRAKTLRAKQAGSEYLNYEFGWLPLVSDLRNFAYAVNNASDIVKRYRDGANQKNRRRLVLSDSLNQQVYSYTDWYKTPWNDTVGQGSHLVTLTNRERMWFSGCYTYYMPGSQDSDAKFERYKQYANRLLGVRLTPDVVWNVAPWSWAVDWKTDVGDVVRNASALGHNGLVLQYGYIMHHVESSMSSVSAGGSWSETTFRKRRVAANPYGFGVSTSGLSTQQLAILAALGLSHGDVRRIS